MQESTPSKYMVRDRHNRQVQAMNKEVACTGFCQGGVKLEMVKQMFLG